jgi:hypothetical protein
MYYLKEMADIHTVQYNANAIEMLNYYNIKYIVIKPSELASEEFKFVKKALDSDLHLNSTYYTDGKMFVYSIPKKEYEKPFILLNEGWNNIEYWKGNPSRWMKEISNVSVISSQSEKMNITFLATSYLEDKKLIVKNNGKNILETTIPNNKWVIVQVPLTIEPGTNVVSLNAIGESVRPSSIPGQNSQDNRAISIAIQNMRLS